MRLNLLRHNPAKPNDDRGIPRNVLCVIGSGGVHEVASAHQYLIEWI